MHSRTTKRDNGGFTYLALLLVIVVMAAVLGGTADVWHATVQREKERELLFAGNQIRKAIRLYYRDHASYPRNLEDLLKDPHSAVPRRYLRKIYRDPMTAEKNWVVVRRADGGIVGVHSQSEKAPMKIAGFGTAGSSFDGAVKYSDWVFVYWPRSAAKVQKPVSGLGGRKP